MWLLESWNSKFTWHKKLTVSVGGFTDSVDIVTALADNFTSVYYAVSYISGAMTLLVGSSDT